MATQLNETTTVFILEGAEIQEALRHRVVRHQKEIDACLQKVSSALEERSVATESPVSTQAAGLMLVLAIGEYLTADTLVAKAQMERAAFLSHESLELSCIAKNLVPSMLYKVTLEEAKRYGLV